MGKGSDRPHRVSEGRDFDGFLGCFRTFFELDAYPAADGAFGWRLGYAALTPEGDTGGASRLHILHVRTTGDWWQLPPSDGDDIIITLPLRGRILSAARTSTPIGSGQAIIYQPLGVRRNDMQTDGRVYEALCVRMGLRHAQSVLQRRLQRPVEADLRLDPVIDVKRGKGRLLSLLMRNLASEIFADAAAGMSPPLQSQIIETFNHLLLESTGHRYSARLDRQPASPLPRPVRVARDYMGRHARGGPTMAQVARAAGVSVRTLEVHFREYLDTSPAAYLRTLRLQLAHEALLDPSDLRPVTELARSSGFAHAGRFAQYYQTLFGETPSDTRRKAGR